MNHPCMICFSADLMGFILLNLDSLICAAIPFADLDLLWHTIDITSRRSHTAHRSFCEPSTHTIHASLALSMSWT